MAVSFGGAFYAVSQRLFFSLAPYPIYIRSDAVPALKEGTAAATSILVVSVLSASFVRCISFLHSVWLEFYPLGIQTGNPACRNGIWRPSGIRDG